MLRGKCHEMLLGYQQEKPAKHSIRQTPEGKKNKLKIIKA